MGWLALCLRQIGVVLGGGRAPSRHYAEVYLTVGVHRQVSLGCSPRWTLLQVLLDDLSEVRPPMINFLLGHLNLCSTLPDIEQIFAAFQDCLMTPCETINLGEVTQLSPATSIYSIVVLFVVVDWQNHFVFDVVFQRILTRSLWVEPVLLVHQRQRQSIQNAGFLILLFRVKLVLWVIDQTLPIVITLLHLLAHFHFHHGLQGL